MVYILPPQHLTHLLTQHLPSLLTKYSHKLKIFQKW